jgi:hypothetical protein
LEPDWISDPQSLLLYGQEWVKQGALLDYHMVGIEEKQAPTVEEKWPLPCAVCYAAQHLLEETPQ